MPDLDDLVSQLLNGWNERVEYGTVINGRIEKRIERRHQPPLVDQLIEAQYAPPAKGSDGSGGGSSVNKPKSRPPGNLERPDEILCRIGYTALEFVCRANIAVTHPRRTRMPRLRGNLAALIGYDWPQDDLEELVHDLGSHVRQARMLLGYDSGSVAFQNTVCGNCGGALTIARDNPSAVRCSGTPAAPSCGTSYPWWQWPELAQAATEQLVDTEVAVAWTGRPRETLYRWAREQRITRHGDSSPRGARWNLAELPRAVPGVNLPDAPPRKPLLTPPGSPC